MKKTKILLVDDHAVVRKGLISLLEDEKQINIIGDVAGGEEALLFASNNLPDMLLLDLNMPNMSGTETAKQFSKLYPSVKKLVFSMHNNAEYILNSIENGVDGYLLKDCDKEEILEAIETVSGGDRYFPQSVSAILVGALQNKNKKSGSVNEGKITKILSKKETQILKLIAEGKNSKDIAEKLDLSIRTVSNHRANMLKKTNLNNTAELVRIASKEGL
jgi:DNA-binding NarL/FixJ family response regulator